MIPDYELPGYLIVIIIILASLALLLALAFLGYLPSPLTSKLDAHDLRGMRADRAALITCAATMEIAKRSPIKCFDNTQPWDIFVGAR